MAQVEKRKGPECLGAGSQRQDLPHPELEWAGSGPWCGPLGAGPGGMRRPAAS